MTDQQSADDVDIESLVAGIDDGDVGALARAITILEDRTDGYHQLRRELDTRHPECHVIGVTGAPGTGKSTLVDALTQDLADETSVGVLAVDPAAVASGGAVLGDRIRMAPNPAIFIRSMSTRGTPGGIAPAVADVLAAYRAFGFDYILVETVGTGQSEVAVVTVADTVVVLVSPVGGDLIQTLKGGVLEIGDIFVVNKADCQGADQTAMELREMVRAEGSTSRDWQPAVVQTVATTGTGVTELREELTAHRQTTATENPSLERMKTRIRGQVRQAVDEQLQGDDRLDDLAQEVLAGERQIRDAAETLATSILEHNE